MAITIASLFTPTFPPQSADVSYGFAATGTNALLVPTGAVARALVPRDGSLGTTWTLPAFDDSGWISGTTGVGYERASGYESLLGLDLLSASLPPAQRMDRDGDGLNENNSVFVRVPFVLSNPSSLNTLTLRMRYDDGFAAYLNGQRVASDNEPPVLAWNSSAASDYGDVTDVMMAIVYGPGNSITIYRNGQVYADAAHATFGTLQTYPANVADVLIGKRHIALSDGGTASGIDGFLAGSVNEARVYGAPLGPATFSNFTPSARLVAPTPPRRRPRRTCSTCGRSTTVPPVTRWASLTARCSTAPLSTGAPGAGRHQRLPALRPIRTNLSVRTLVVWVALANLAQQAGSALTIENPPAQCVRRHHLRRTRAEPMDERRQLFRALVADNGGPPETVVEAPVQVHGVRLVGADWTNFFRAQTCSPSTGSTSAPTTPTC